MTEISRDAVGLVQILVQSLVDDPEAVAIRTSSEADALLIEISVAADDVSKVIGRHGRIIKAIRTLARAASAVDGQERVEVEIIS
ncbi:MAG: KH domain-containing protein [Actinomycetia bacterium]|nr:KH domain-containing protein [Actinomycetes bacterium]